MKNPSPPDILLAAMPFTLIRWPSLSLGLLKRILTEKGLCCEVYYGNISYGEQVGLDAFLFAENGWTRTFLCDWLFQRKLFPEGAVSSQKFVLDYLRGNRLPKEKLNRAIHIVEVLRNQSEAFLETLTQRIIERAPAIVGCSLMVVQLFSTLALFRELKTRAPHIITLAGGPACEALPGMALHRYFPQIDFLFSGDADQSIYEVVTAIAERGVALPVSDAPHGLLTPAHRQSGYPEVPPRVRFNRLDENPLPDHDDYFAALAAAETVGKRLDPALVFEGSRGCWWGERALCKFCGDCGVYPKYRPRSGHRVMEDLMALSERHGITRFVSTDNVVNPDFFGSLFPILPKRNPSWSLFFEIRSGLRKDEMEALRHAGVIQVQAGIESLHSRSLKAMNKGVRSWQNIQCLKWCRQYGISISWFFLTRFPGEKDAWNRDQAELVPLLTHLQPPKFVGIIRPDRHSPYFTDPGFARMNIRPKPLYLDFFGKLKAHAHEFVFHLEDQKVQELLSDPLEDLVQPGRKMLLKAAGAWQKAFFAEQPAMLEMQRRGDEWIILDTRGRAGERTYVVTKSEAEILELADSAPRETHFYSACRENGINREEADTHVQNFMDKGFILLRDGRILSLVLHTPCRPLPAEKDLPIGWIAGEERIKGADPLTCDAFWELV